MILVDTWAWIALADRRDPYHAIATQARQAHRRQRRRYVTTDYILTETISPLFGELPFARAEQYMFNLLESIRLGRCQLERITPDRAFSRSSVPFC